MILPFGRPEREPADRAGALVCSAKGCRAPAVWALRWNNPTLHDPERRKTWLACADHRESLGQFLGVRGFLREVELAPGAPGAPAPGAPDAPDADRRAP